MDIPDAIIRALQEAEFLIDEGKDTRVCK